jgi:hypothetical protein
MTADYQRRFEELAKTFVGLDPKLIEATANAQAHG